MLTYYTPAKGIFAGSQYTLPIETQRKRGLGGVDDSVQPGRMQGKHYGAGGNQPYIGGGTVSPVFQITPGFATTTRGFAGLSDMAAVESAVDEFKLYVVSGGLGTLVDVPSAGYAVNGTICTQKICTARTTPSSVSEDWQDGGTICEITLDLESPVGYWSAFTGGGTFIAWIPI